MATIPTFEDVTNAAKEAVYTVVGLGVLTYQDAKVRREEFKARLEKATAEGKAEFERFNAGAKDKDGLKALEARFTALEERIESLLDEIQENLPSPAKDMLKQARETAAKARTQVRDLLNRGEAKSGSQAA